MELERLTGESLGFINSDDACSISPSISSFIPDKMCLQNNCDDLVARPTSLGRSSNEFDSSDNECEFNFAIENEKDFVVTKHSSNYKHLGLQLGKWAVDHNITHSALTSLLHLLKPFHKELPLDSRTLLKTQRNIELMFIEPGQYYHFGFKNVVEKIIDSDLNDVESDVIELFINIDGLPLSKSSGSQCYPILCKLSNVNRKCFKMRRRKTQIVFYFFLKFIKYIFLVVFDDVFTLKCHYDSCLFFYQRESKTVDICYQK